ncbi:MAG: TIGR02266 family protein [Polyangiaceae bacterium]
MSTLPFGSSPPSAPDAVTEPQPSQAGGAPDSINRRSSPRLAVTWSVDCLTEDTFLYASIRNISEMGIFVSTLDPLPVGTALTLRFAPPGACEPFNLLGRVQWVNSLKPLSDNLNPGMGVRFVDLTIDARERLVEAIRTIAYVRYDLS